MRLTKMNFVRRTFAWAALLSLVYAGVNWAARAATDSRPVLHINVKGMINPATARYIIRGIEKAETEGDQALILQMDTPGGLDSSMRDIIRKILSARVPVVVYVAPDSARALAHS